MESKHTLWRKLLVVFIAAICGGATFDMMIVINNWAYNAFARGRSGLIPDLVKTIAFILVIPPAFVSRLVGKGELLNPYLVNGCIGALLFAVIAAFWQFVVKNHHES